MSRPADLLRRLRLRTRSSASGDAGMTLVELCVAMFAFSVLLAAVLSAIVTTTQTSMHAQNSADTGTDVRKAFLLLDKQVRYADAVNFPGASAGAYYVEFRTVPAGQSASQCVQWRYDPASGQVQTRSWPSAGTPDSAWATLFTTATSQGDPFTMLPTTTQRPMQELRFSITDSRALGGGATQIDTTFVARNSTPTSPGNADVNNDGASDTPVCAPAGYRS